MVAVAHETYFGCTPSFAAKFVEDLITRALDDDAEFFIGIVVEKTEQEAMMKRLDDAAAEAVAKLYGKRAKK